MLSTKRLVVLSCALALTALAHAQAKPAAAHVQPANARVPAADFDVGTAASSVPATPVIAASAAAQAAASAPVLAAVPAQPSRLSIDDIDQKIRAQVARQLSGDGGPGAGVGLNTPAPQPNPAPPVVVIKSQSQQSSRARTEPAKFVGAFNDATGSSVLYEFRGAYYPAHIGEKLLNGWRVAKISGFLVTVTDGEGKKPHTWTEPIAGGAASIEPQDTAGPARTLNDLSGALPPPLPAPLISNGG